MWSYQYESESLAEMRRHLNSYEPKLEINKHLSLLVLDSCFGKERKEKHEEIISYTVTSTFLTCLNGKA